LRDFEFAFLQELGYAVDFQRDAHSGEAIVPERHYWFDAQMGFYQVDPISQHGAAAPVFDGSTILAMARRNFDAQETRQAAKRLRRFMLQPRRGSRPLRSGELFMSTRSELSLFFYRKNRVDITVVAPAQYSINRFVQ